MTTPSSTHNMLNLGSKLEKPKLGAYSYIFTRRGFQTKLIERAQASRQAGYDDDDGLMHFFRVGLNPSLLLNISGLPQH